MAPDAASSRFVPVDNAWNGKGSSGRHAVAQGRPHGFRGYWWFRRADGTSSDVEWCLHAHKTQAAADRCGRREAAHRNRRAVVAGGRAGWRY